MVCPPIMYHWSLTVKARFSPPPPSHSPSPSFLSHFARVNVGGGTEHDSSALLNVDEKRGLKTTQHQWKHRGSSDNGVCLLSLICCFFHILFKMRSWKLFFIFPLFVYVYLQIDSINGLLRYNLCVVCVRARGCLHPISLLFLSLYLCKHPSSSVVFSPAEICAAKAPATVTLMSTASASSCVCI